jgi:hypothetical protein
MRSKSLQKRFYLQSDKFEETLIILANSEKHKLQYRSQTNGTPCTMLLLHEGLKSIYIRALSAHSAVEFNSSPGRWQHVWLVANVPPERWGKMDRNDCHTAWGNFKKLISSLHHSKNYACYFSLIDFLFYFDDVFLSF